MISLKPQEKRKTPYLLKKLEVKAQSHVRCKLESIRSSFQRHTSRSCNMNVANQGPPLAKIFTFLKCFCQLRDCDKVGIFLTQMKQHKIKTSGDFESSKDNSITR